MLTIEGYQVEYATTCPFSLDNKLILLQTLDGAVSVFSTSNPTPLYVVKGLAAYQEPRWDSYDPAIYYHIRKNSIIKRNAIDNTESVHKVFPEFIEEDPGWRPGIQDLGEGDIEGNNFALAGMRPDGKREVFLYDIVNNIKGKTLLLDRDDSNNSMFGTSFFKTGRAHGLDNLYATPDGNIQIGWTTQGTDRFQGVELYDKDMNFIRQLATVMGHNDTSKRGLVWCSSADAVENRNSAILIDKDNNSRKELINFSWKWAFHVSCCDKDYCIISTYDPSGESPIQIWKVKLDGSKNDLIWEDKILYEGYISQPRAAVSQDGSLVAFNYYDNSRKYITKIIEVPQDKQVEVPSPGQSQGQSQSGIETKYDLNSYRVVIDNNTLSLIRK